MLTEKNNDIAQRRTHLYRHYSADGALLYVGISLSAISRLGQHADHATWFDKISRVEITAFDTRDAALAAEREAIARERPVHNIQHSAAQDTGKAARRAEEDKCLLTERVVNYSAMYKLKEVARELSVTTQLASKWVAEGRLGHCVLPNRVGKPVKYVSGWQLIEFIEAHTAKDR